MDRCLKAAWFLVTAPLVTGVTIFVAWLVFRSYSLMYLGILTIYGGVLCVSVGALFLTAYMWRSLRGSTVPNRRLVRQAVCWIALCGFDFVAAGGLAWAALSIETCYTVVIQNNSGMRINNARLTGGGVNIAIGTIAPGESSRQRLWFSRDGELVLIAKQGERTITTTIEGYVCSSFRGYVTVTYLGPGELIIERKERHR